METSDKYEEIFKALAAFQAKVPFVQRTKRNAYTKSDYSDLEDLITAVREPLAEQGLFFLQDATLHDLTVAVTTRICHISGQWLEFGPYEVPCGRRDAHSVGSATSYAKRYALSAALGVVSGMDDDDGNEALGRENNSDQKADSVITPKLAGVIKERLNGKPELVKELLKECKVSSVDQIRASQMDTVCAFMRNHGVAQEKEVKKE